MQNFRDVRPKDFDYIQQHSIKDYRFKPMKIINWKTSLIGFAILVVKFLESVNILPQAISEWLVQLLTGLLGLFAADNTIVKKL